MKPPIDPSNLSSEQKDTLIVQLFEQIAKPTDEINELKSRLSKNSRSSSKPPASDGYSKLKPKSRSGKIGKSEYRRYKPPTTIKPPPKNSLNRATFISESAAMTCPQTV